MTLAYDDGVNVEAIGRYQIFAQVGSGGFATVHRAWDPTLERELAVKVLHPHLARNPQLRERFVREGRALARVRHPNIVQVYDAGEADGAVFIAMEFVPGRSLADLAQGQQLPLGMVLTVVEQVAQALEAVHAAGLVHRDIKPANILITPEGRAVLLDLGIARQVEGAPYTTTGMLLGTPGYLAPEQVDSTLPVGPWTDVYQLAATTYVLLAGRPPFEGDTAQVLYAVAHRPPAPLAELRAGLPPRAVAAVERAMAKLPEHRPSSPAAFAAELASAAASLPAPSVGMAAAAERAGPDTAAPPVAEERTTARRPPPAPTPPTPPPRRTGPVPVLAAVAGGLAGIALLGGAAYALARRDGPPPARPRLEERTRSLAATHTVTPTLTRTAAPTVPPSPSPLATPSPTTTPVRSPSPTATRTAAPTPTPIPIQIKLPTEPRRSIPIPETAGPVERAILTVLNLNGPSYISAMRGVDESPLSNVFTGPALEYYTKAVRDLRDNRQYYVADLVSISLVEFRIDGPDRAYARTVERWRTELYARAGNRRLSGADTTYDEEYEFVRINGQWYIRSNTFKVIAQTTS